MKKSFGLMFGLLLSACGYVGPGEEGVLVNSLGDGKGVVSEPLTTGYYYLGMFSHLYSFPTFTQTYTWDKGNNEQITFGVGGGNSITTDVGITYHIEPGKVPLVFQKYRRGINEITNIYLHNMVRDAMNEVGSKHPIEYVYGEGKGDFINQVQEMVSGQVKPIGINIERVYWIGKLGLPTSIEEAINGKTAAVQIALKKEFELASSKADAAKLVAEAQGEGDALLIKAQKQSEANRVLAQSLTRDFVQYQEVLKWDGRVPMVSGNTSGLLLNMPQGQNR